MELVLPGTKKPVLRQARPERSRRAQGERILIRPSWTLYKTRITTPVPLLNQPRTVATMLGPSIVGALAVPNPLSADSSPSHLIVEGARQNNLKNISLHIPHDRVTAITGLSGSGKSSLAFDTLFAEGQWRYVESLSTYARMFLDKVARPDVDRIQNVR
ncbi:MAG: excinuclease ABC subunit A, partial [Nitrospira sp.]|nr:excinuclease ABC subunit A [Nitrospira sp.]